MNKPTRNIEHFRVPFIDIWRCLVIILLLFPFSSLRGQQDNNYVVEANIIYHFTKYIDWPDSLKTGDFIIAVVGTTPLYDEMKESMVNKKAGDQKIVIKKYPATADFLHCHIVFIGEDQSSNLKKISAKTAGSPVLLVSEGEGLAGKGSCINFAMISDHLKLEINKNNIEQRSLSIATELLQLGKIVK